MSETQYSTIKAKIKAELATITELQAVYDYKKGDLNSYPVACIEECKGSSELMSTRTNQREMLWTIKVYQEMEKDGVGVVEAESRIDTIIDQLWNLFDDEWQMDCNVDNSFINSIDVGWEEREASMRVITVELSTTKLYTLT